MRFTEVTKEEILEKRDKHRDFDLKEDLKEFLASGFQYARVEEEDHYYNNNNDLRRAIQHCIKHNDLPMVVFMYQGSVYIERL